MSLMMSSFGFEFF